MLQGKVPIISTVFTEEALLVNKFRKIMNIEYRWSSHAAINIAEFKVDWVTICRASLVSEWWGWSWMPKPFAKSKRGFFI